MGERVLQTIQDYHLLQKSCLKRLNIGKGYQLKPEKKESQYAYAFSFVKRFSFKIFMPRSISSKDFASSDRVFQDALRFKEAERPFATMPLR